MEEDKKLPERKRNRLSNYDYSSFGAYFITICTKDRKNIFWEKEQSDFVVGAPQGEPKTVGEDIILPQQDVKLSLYGKIVDRAIKSISEKYSHVELSQYVIMPNHVHLILLIGQKGGRIISSPTDVRSVSTVVGQMKRQASKDIGAPIWQRSFHDHIIRNYSDYRKISKYIYENPMKWEYDCFYSEE